MKYILLAVMVFVGSVWYLGCNDGGDKVICTPGVTRVCQCATGGVGIEGCVSDGTAWTPCYCVGDGDADGNELDATDIIDTTDTTDTVDNDPVDDVDGVCSDGAKECRGTAVYACLADAWSYILDCAASGQVCSFGECTAAPDGDDDTVDTGTCSNGQVRCIGNIVYVCNAQQWVLQENCGDSDRVCSNGICTCTAGEKKCDDDNLQTCISNSWQTTTNCALQDETCVDGACACIDGQTKCEGTVRYYCGYNSWDYDSYDCADSNDNVCYEGECVICYGDMTKCDGDYLYHCEIDDYWGNNWEYDMDCSENGGTCVNGACVPAR